MPAELVPLPWSKSGCRALAERIGLYPRRRHGQNFLPSAELLDRIVAAAGVGPGDRVLEVGPGLGHLSDRLLRAGARLTVAELDPRLAAHLRLHFGPGIELIEGDVLDGLHRVAPAVSDWLAARSRPVSVVANLPYSIATPLLALLVERSEITQIVATVQREVADRLCAAPGCKEYGALTVVVGLRAAVERLFEVPASAFWPRPEVRSEAIRLVPRPSDPAGGGAALLGELVHAAFAHRRKTLLNSLLKSRFLKDLSSEPAAMVREALREQGRDERARAEQLSAAELLAIAGRLAGTSAGKTT